MALCLAAAGVGVKLALTAFSLLWTHSVEKTAWREDWQLTPQGLLLASAHVQGSGAGMEVPDGAQWQAGGWRYHPGITVPELRLMRSRYVADYQLCPHGEACRPLWHWLPAADTVTVVTPCED